MITSLSPEDVILTALEIFLNKDTGDFSSLAEQIEKSGYPSEKEIAALLDEWLENKPSLRKEYNKIFVQLRNERKTERQFLPISQSTSPDGEALHKQKVKMLLSKMRDVVHVLNCVTCKGLVNAKEIDSYFTPIQTKDSMANSPDKIGTKYKFTFLQCTKCSHPFITRTEYSDNPEHYNDPTYGQPKTLYPTSEKTISSEIPTYIRTVLEEAIRCYANKAFIASVIMCIKTLEYICKDYKIEAVSLEKKLNKMKEQEIIDQNLYDWADRLRVTENDFVHKSITCGATDAQHIINFTYTVTDYIFTYRKKIEHFKQNSKKVSEKINR
ncbi:hypothetical protein B7O87_01415 [Cylindrospermopsis raciborskii CENA303]|uniref:DUF4145 domain-containing protein n=1 Tax=Cylindrospermopsis raciborskii CENA303 TaxID=1170769 RepID=A0A1X4GJC5_9CYAN|nr:DUF4145 domain-containing protein [Cylindrospermopsis raciborskii]EFA73635.1 hypothetical protein CRD_01142 [Raphidiopsis brookii D9]OSO97160.1 hypothetical protein B7O87_01415 [Cylindrospermopsis raciborskii CENA303]